MDTKGVEEKLACLRALMGKKGVDAYIINGSDNHCSEYSSARWRTRQWLSGFSGSAGIIVLTKEQCGLWTDYRYWIQAETQLKGSDIELFCVGDGDVLEPQEWLVRNLPSGSLAALDGRTFTLQHFLIWEKSLERESIRIVWDMDIISDCWKSRPALSEGRYWELSEESAGETRKQKIERLKKYMAKKKVDIWIGMSLDSVAWLLNLRAGEGPYTPVGEGYFVISNQSSAWYTDRQCISADLRRKIEEEGIRIYPYGEFMDALAKIPSFRTAILDPDVTSYAIARRLSCQVVYEPDPVVQMKACKNEVEIRNIRQAMRKDGAALVQFICELHNRLGGGEQISETDAALLLTGKRKSFPGYISDSFATIAAYGPNAALAHYEPRADVFLKPRENQMFLLDSGGQWMEGTTDITRTIALGEEATEQQKRHYTLVLKGHLALAAAQFPQNICGYQLDTLARRFLWEQGLDYGHGTGHGVGYILNVHEGPQNISSKPVDVPIRPGMIVSNEPGLYSRDEFGIRIENIILCREAEGILGFYRFETLTLAPYCRALIDAVLLDAREKEQINSYHTRVKTGLAEFLGKEEKEWLSRETEPLI